MEMPKNNSKLFCEPSSEEDPKFDEPLSNDIGCNKLINGISIQDLCDGKEVMFEVAKNEERNVEDEIEELSDEVLHCDIKSMREKRGAPLGLSFEEIAAKMKNVTEDGLVKKQVVTSGIGKQVSDFAYVTVHYNLYKRTSELPFDSTYLRNKPEKFRLGQNEIILGLEYAIKSMKKNENSMFFIKWELAFGALGCPERIEEKCDIVADVMLVNFVDVDEEDSLTHSEVKKIDFNQSINQAKQLLRNGSEDFTKGNTKAAIISYRKAVRILNNLRLLNEEEENQMLDQKVKCLVNLAVCYNKINNPEQACIACQQVLSIDHNNLKANFHYGRANISLSNFSDAHRYLSKADKLKPNDHDINKELKRLNDKKALCELKDKLFWKKAFKTNMQKDDDKNKEADPLKLFEKHLRITLIENLNKNKSHIIFDPLQENELRICKRVANEMNLQFETHPHFYIFRNIKKSG